jgi:hypothetical protein
MKVQKGEAMKTKWWKKACIGLFVVAMLMNLTVYFDSAGERSSDLNLGNLNVNLFQKAYGYTVTSCTELGCWGGTQKCGEYTVGDNGTRYCYQKEGDY